MDNQIIPVTESTAVDTASANTRSWKFHLDRIVTVWRKGARDVIAVGQYLLAAQDELSREAFTTMTEKLDFNDSVVRKLKAIARNETLCSPENGNNLPREWTVLYHLSQLSEGALKAAFADGRIHPRMSRKDAIALKPMSKAIDKPAPTNSVVLINSTELIPGWQAASQEQQRAFFDWLGREGLCAAASPAFLADLRDHVIGLHMAGASKSSSFAVYGTDKLHAALYCAAQPEPDLKKMAALLNCIAKNAAAKGIMRSTVVIAEGKPKGRKK